MTDPKVRGPLVDALVFALLGIGSLVAGVVGLFGAFSLWLLALDRATRWAIAGRQTR
jgi:hypothetical protein